MRHTGLVLLAVLACSPVRAQELYEPMYRPGEARYDVLKSDHFDVIYQRGLEDQAGETAFILEETLEETRVLIGLRRVARMPVVLNNFNDRSNGYVTPIPFRQEIEAAAPKGAGIDPGFDSWMEAVLPHELTHALHAEVRPQLGFGGLLALFSPDLSRALNFSIPLGMTEGAAVYRESLVRPGVGRLHHGYFESRMRAAMASRRPWRLAQMLEPSAYTMPYDRHYVGGGYVFEYLSQNRKADFFARSLTIYNTWPFFGYGFALWKATGLPPWVIGKRVRSALGADVPDAPSASASAGLRLASRHGVNHYRPLWLDAQRLLIYADGYATRPGFYTINLADGHHRSLSTQSATEDRFATLSDDRQTVYFSRYEPNRFAGSQWTADLHALDVMTGAAHRLTSGAHLFSPAPAPGDALWAVRNRGQFTDWVEVLPRGDIRTVLSVPRAVIRQVSRSPQGDRVAVSAGVAGRSVVFFAVPTDAIRPNLEPALASDEAGFFDLSWSPDGRYLLFGSDAEGTPQVYAFDTATRRVLRVTEAPFGAFEGSVSPDGQSMAATEYRHERRDLIVKPFPPADAHAVPDSVFFSALGLPWMSMMASGPIGRVEGVRRPYRSGPHLVRPRLVIPVFDWEETVRTDDVDLGLAAGLALEGVDPLETWAYGLRIAHQAGRLWGEAGLETGKVWWRPSVRLYDTASSQRVLLSRSGGVVDTARVGREERGLEFAGVAPLLLRSNVFRTEATFRLSARLRQVRFFDRATGILDDFPSALAYATRGTLSPSLTLGYRLQSNARDLMPNTGWLLQSSSELDVVTRSGVRNGEPPPAGRAWLTTANRYVTTFPSANQALRIQAAVLTQNRGSIYDLDAFVPRGYEEDLYLGSGTFLKASGLYMAPLWFADTGFVVVPLYLEALFAYGFGEVLAEAGSDRRWSSVGAGIGLQLKLAQARLTLRIGAARQIESGKWVLTFR